VVWLKRDVRLSDHQCIALAARQSEMPIVLLYVYERCHLQSDTYHESHHAFINQGLAELELACEQSRTLAVGSRIAWQWTL